jgi:hypothetical protein
MKRLLIATVLFAFTYTAAPAAPPSAQQQKKKKVPCKRKLADCPDEGCGTDFDPELNKRKNMVSDDRDAAAQTLLWMKKLDDPENFAKGDTREELAALGEGQKISVVAYLLVAKPELGGESCNCGLQTPAETDNHLVLVSKSTINKFPLSSGADSKAIFTSREKESETAEFTPRVRLQHANFTREKVQPLINATKQKALLVRVTGLLLFDSEHFLANHLVRINNWEIHPVLKLEYCTTGSTCKAGSDDGWKSLDDLP